MKLLQPSDDIKGISFLFMDISQHTRSQGYCINIWKYRRDHRLYFINAPPWSGTFPDIAVPAFKDAGTGYSQVCLTGTMKSGFFKNA